MPDRSRVRDRQFHKDNRGSTLVVVIVAMLLLCTLASIILYTTYVNYTIKTTELHSTDNFYTAESIMEEIKAGLELEVSNAYTDAYLFIMQNYHSSDDTGEVLRTTNFQTRYINYLKDKFDPDRDESMEPEILLDYVSYETKTGAEAVFSDGSKAKLELVPADGKSLVAYTDGIWIKGLRLTYTDQNGYVAVITTDIALKIPNMTFEEQNSLPGVLSYSLIADKKLYLGISDTVIDGHYVPVGGTYTVRGSVYGGKNGISVSNSRAKFEAAEAGGSYVVVTGGNVEVQGAQNPDGSFDAGFTTTGNASLWADGIMVDSSELNLSGESYVQDDLTVNGKNSSIVLSGQYYGFGYQSVSTAAHGPKDSSSILINGTGITLDLSALTVLDLAGQAYIGTTDADGDGIEDEAQTIVADDGTEYDTSGNQTVRMGESLSVRSNQLAYLVPPECIGYIDGECVVGTNPITLNQYQEFQQAAAAPGVVSSLEVDLTKAELAGETMAMTLRDYGAAWQKVFYQAAGAGNNAWVYYYLTFNSAAQANAFFVDYYSQNKAWMNSYLGNYLHAYRVPADMEKLNLAGNAVYYDESTGEFSLQPASSWENPEDMLGLLADYERCSNTNKALNMNLTMNYAALTQDQLDRASVFENIVDVDKLREYMGGSSAKEIIAAGGQKVLLIDNADGAGAVVGASTSVYEVPEDSDVKVVIATGDVRVNRNYRGMILSGGQIFVTNSAVLEPDPDAVSLALQADSGRLLACFWEGKKIAGEGTPTPSPGEEESEVVGTDELVVYRNWKKD